MKIIYGDKQIAESGNSISPSAIKPKYLAELLKQKGYEFLEPIPVDIDDIKRCHDSEYVDNIMNLKVKNGFGSISQSVVDSLPYTNGAVYQAARLSIDEKMPVAALVSGFHHAGYAGFENFGYFCTFNGLMIAAPKLKQDGLKRVAIVDCDMHYGNGTDDILKTLNDDSYLNITFGKLFSCDYQASAYLRYFDQVREILKRFMPEAIIYQSGADVHVNDPFGGILTEEQMYVRDVKMFKIAKDLDIPISWSLAGGYQVDSQGKFDYVLQLHLNTFKACEDVYGL